MFTALLAQANDSASKVNDIFGKVKVESGPSDLYQSSVPEAMGTIFVFLITLVFVVAGLAVLVYFLWGAFNYITSAGEAEAAAMAKGKILNAGIGLILMIVLLVIWVFLTEITGIITRHEGGFSFNLPRLEGGSGGNGGSGGSGGSNTTPGQGSDPLPPEKGERQKPF